MINRTTRRLLAVFAAWLPFFAIWYLLALNYGKLDPWNALLGSLIAMGSASLLGLAVWHVTTKLAWPDRLGVRFYLQQVALATLYALSWAAIANFLDSLREGKGLCFDFWNAAVFGWQILMGIWLYALFAGISYAVQIRRGFEEKERLAAQAQALAARAQMEAIRARLDPHFLFNALHTLSALVKFRPAAAEQGIERLGDMLRYALKEESRDLVEFADEQRFTLEYVEFEKLRFEERLQVEIEVDPACFEFELPPYSIQTLVENAVRHAISTRPEGGSIAIRCVVRESRLHVSVRDDGPESAPAAGDSHQLGLKSLRERLASAFGSSVEFHHARDARGYEARFSVPHRGEESAAP